MTSAHGFSGGSASRPPPPRASRPWTPASLKPDAERAGGASLPGNSRPGHPRRDLGPLRPRAAAMPGSRGRRPWAEGYRRQRLPHFANQVVSA
jgi:hypothetical protein